MKELLIEVKKAYRLLFDYQNRILDLMDFIGKTYEIDFSAGYSQYSRVVRKKGQLHNWAWDWLPMYYYEFFFEEEKAGAGHLRLSVFLLNDSGFYDSSKDNKSAHKLDISSYKPIEETKTQLIFLAGKDFWWDDWDKNTNSLPRLENEGKAENGDLVYKKYNLERFGNEDDTMKQLEDFSKFCTDNNIPLQISKRKLNLKI